MTHPGSILKKILTQASTLHANGRRTLAVFDLDSTLFDVSPRLQKIMIDFANLPENKTRFPESCEILKEAKTLRSDWGLKNALIRAGLDGHHPEFHHALKEFWYRNFFSNDYLKFDLPYEGAQDFTQKLFSLGTEIIYLSGRDVPRMWQGTIEVLKHWNFPLDDERARVVLKPEKGLDDARFKTDFFTALPDGHYQTIWFFENEPMNTNLVGQTHNHIEIVFFESTHSGVQQPHPNLPKIVHFLLEE